MHFLLIIRIDRDKFGERKISFSFLCFLFIAYQIFSLLFNFFPVVCVCVCVYSPPLFIYPQTPALVTATQFPYIICNVQTNIIEHHRRNGKKVARTNEKPSPQNEKLELAIEAPEEEKKHQQHHQRSTSQEECRKLFKILRLCRP